MNVFGQKILFIILHYCILLIKYLQRFAKTCKTLSLCLTACIPDDKAPKFESLSKLEAVRYANASRSVCKVR